jgi:hypothetical protein
MATWSTRPPIAPFTDGNEMLWWDYFTRQQAFMVGLAKLDEQQAFVAPQSFLGNGGVESGGILLRNNYAAFIDVQKASSNLRDAAPGGGNAAIYVQHSIDGTAANSSNVNSGIRVQVETEQQRASAAYVNDVVSGYFGVRNRGVDVGGFGIHVDAYSFGTGAATTMYGVSAEMYRESAAGFTAAFHARTIDAVGYFDNDYGFLASPSVAGVKQFNTAFSGGSPHTGVLQCDYGLDLAYASCNDAAIRFPAEKYIIWDGGGGQIQTRYENVGRIAHYVSGVYQFGVENTGRLFIVNNANTVVATAFVASGNSLVINIGGVLGKIQIGNYP